MVYESAVDISEALSEARCSTWNADGAESRHALGQTHGSQQGIETTVDVVNSRRNLKLGWFAPPISRPLPCTVPMVNTKISGRWMFSFPQMWHNRGWSMPTSSETVQRCSEKVGNSGHISWGSWEAWISLAASMSTACQCDGQWISAWG